MKDKFIECTGRTQLEPKISVIHNFVSQDIFKPQIDEGFRLEFGLPKDSFLLLTVSRLVFGKGYAEKINVFEKLLISNHLNLYWLIVGEGDDNEAIKELVIERSLEDRVLFLGALARPELARVYSNCDLFWLLSNYKESFGLAYIEAQSCGCPALGWNASGVREAILDGVTGYLVDSEEDILELFSSISPHRTEFKVFDEFVQRFHSRNLVKFIQNLNTDHLA